jgi:hypothetical protein
LILIPIEKTKEDAAKAEAAGAGGLEDDDVWGDVEDVSTFLHFVFHFVLTK